MVIETLKRFLKKQSELKNSTLLLGYSGGADSKALLYALLACKKEFGFYIDLVHVDHGWREESSKEAIAISQEAKKLGVGFHLLTLSKPEKGNLENYYRDKRRAFFLDVARKSQAKAIFLAHHRDDVAETVLKRFFEGAGLLKMEGIKEESEIESLKVLRPFLSLPKKDLISFLSTHKLDHFNDLTNGDETYLRARMRKKIFPYIEDLFGKKISTNMIHFSKKSQELSEYLSRRIAPYMSSFQGNAHGGYIDLSNEEAASFEKVEFFHLLETLLEKYALSISRISKEDVYQAFLKRKALAVPLKEAFFLYLDRNCLFIVKRSQIKESTGELTIFAEGDYLYENIQIHVRSFDSSSHNSFPMRGWPLLWSKGSSILLPKGRYSLLGYQEGMRNGQKRLKKLWQEQKVPAFLREYIPLVVDNEGEVRDFLSSNPHKESYCEGPKWIVTVNI